MPTRMRSKPGKRSLRPALQSAVHRPLEHAPQASAHSGARQPRAERIPRKARRTRRVDVWHKGRGRHALELPRQSRREREYVRYDDVRSVRSLTQRLGLGFWLGRGHTP